MEQIYISEWTLLLLLMIYESVGSPELICPDVGYLGSPAHLMCISSSNITSHGYVTSQDEVAAICSLSSSPCTTMGNYMASTINQTHSSLTIPAVQQAHAGQWTCSIPPSSPLSCNITVVKLPTCHTTSDVNTTTLDDGEDLSLTVYIKGYYCSELVQLKVSTGRTDHEYPNETVTDITDKTVNIKINKTISNFEAELVFTCGGHSSTLPCHATSRTPSSIPDKNITPGTPNSMVIIGVAVTVVITIIVIVAHVCLKRRTIQQKVPQVLECPNPPYMEFREPLHNTNASVEDLGAQGSGSKKDTSPPCTEAYADTGNYAAVGDTSVPDTKTRKDGLPASMDAGGYSCVADRRVAEKGAPGDDTAKSLDTGYYETVDVKSDAEPSLRQGDLAALTDAVGYSTVDDFKPCPGAASFSHTGRPESIPKQIEGPKTNRPPCELYATVNKKRGTPRLANADATTTSVM
ncbi:uncharacterized protein [Haliotis cracherodii]|uniref:uncharacterized protein n=1 Tax=Haliotis cracherodii TaxID=6455 RepID=UPI0039ED6215